jgi:hypothetical protein
VSDDFGLRPRSLQTPDPPVHSRLDPAPPAYRSSLPGPPHSCSLNLAQSQRRQKRKVRTWTFTFFLDLFLATSSVIPFLCILQMSVFGSA